MFQTNAVEMRHKPVRALTSNVQVHYHYLEVYMAVVCTAINV